MVDADRAGWRRREVVSRNFMDTGWMTSWNFIVVG